MDFRIVASIAAANSDNQLTGTGYAYDGNGNPTSYNGNSLTFDPENRMTEIDSGVTSHQLVTSAYGADGLRAERITYTYQTNPSLIIANPVFYVYDGDEPVAQITYSGANAGQVTLVNTFGANGFVSRHFSGAQDSKFYAFDPQGSVAERVAKDASVDASFVFDAFGGRAMSSPSGVAASDSFCGFGGQWGYWLDSDSGLELLTHRFYDPGAGRFVTRNPAGYQGERMAENEIGILDSSIVHAGRFVPIGFQAIVSGEGVTKSERFITSDPNPLGNLYEVCGNNLLCGIDPAGLSLVLRPSFTKGKTCEPWMWAFFAWTCAREAAEYSKVLCKICVPYNLTCTIGSDGKIYAHCDIFCWF